MAVGQVELLLLADVMRDLPSTHALWPAAAATGAGGVGRGHFAILLFFGRSQLLHAVTESAEQDKDTLSR